MTALEIQHDYEAWLADMQEEWAAQAEMDAAEDEYYAAMAERESALAAMPVALPPTSEEIEAMCAALGCEVPF